MANESALSREELDETSCGGWCDISFPKSRRLTISLASGAEMRVNKRHGIYTRVDCEFQCISLTQTKLGQTRLAG